MVNQYRQRTLLDSNNNKVSSRYHFYKFTEYKTIKLESDRSLDEISYSEYGTPLYYWAIGEANNISDPFVKLKKGSKVKVPVL